MNTTTNNAAMSSTVNNETVVNVNMEKVNTVINKINQCGMYRDFWSEIINCDRKDEKYNLAVMFYAIHHLIDIYDSSLTYEERAYVYGHISQQFSFDYRYHTGTIVAGEKPRMRGDRSYDVSAITYATLVRATNRVNEFLDMYFTRVENGDGGVTWVEPQDKARLNETVLTEIAGNIDQKYYDITRNEDDLDYFTEINALNSGRAYACFSFSNAEAFEEALWHMTSGLTVNGSTPVIRFVSQQDGDNIVPVNEEETAFTAEICIEAVYTEEKIEKVYTDAFLAACKEWADGDENALDEDGYIKEPVASDFDNEEDLIAAWEADSEGIEWAMRNAEKAVIEHFGAGEFAYADCDVRYAQFDFFPTAEKTPAVAEEKSQMSDEDKKVFSMELEKDVRNILVNEYNGQVISDGHIVLQGLEDSDVKDVIDTVTDLAMDEYNMNVEVRITRDVVTLSGDGGASISVVGGVTVNVLGLAC